MSVTADHRRIRAVVFDFFGTLTQAVSRGPAHDLVARRLGCAPDAFTRALNQTFTLRSVGALGGPHAALAVVTALAGGRATTEQLSLAYADRIAAIRADTRLRPDAISTLRTLRDRLLRTAVVSDCTPELTAFWPELPLAGLLDARVLSVEEHRCKPHPAMYREAARRLGVAPDECLYVGDGGSHELTGALRVGMTPIRLIADDAADHLVFRPDSWTGPPVSCLAEVLDLLPDGAAARFGVADVPAPLVRRARPVDVPAGR
jgi:putative hydrolase of the HAD superfamily